MAFFKDENSIKCIERTLLTKPIINDSYCGLVLKSGKKSHICCMASETREACGYEDICNTCPFNKEMVYFSQYIETLVTEYSLLLDEEKNGTIPLSENSYREGLEYRQNLFTKKSRMTIYKLLKQTQKICYIVFNNTLFESTYSQISSMTMQSLGQFLIYLNKYCKEYNV